MEAGYDSRCYYILRQKMIKVCSLDFLKKEKFETDIMTVDGSLLCAKSEKVTPELILRLYFKETYISEAMNQQTREARASADDEIIEHLSSLRSDAVDGLVFDQLKSTKSDALTDSDLVDELAFEVKSDSGEELTDDELSSKTKSGSSEQLVDGELSSREKTDSGEDLPDEEMSSKSKSDLDAEFASKKKSGSGEELTDEELASRVKSVSEQETTPGGPPDLDSDSTEALEAAETAVRAAIKLSKAANEVVDLDKKLEFNEEEAKRISEYSVLMGKTLNFSEKRLKELEQAAYYSNIGRTKFTVGDLADKDFQKKQAHAGYDIIINEKKLSQGTAEAVKFCVVNYDSSAFKLGGEIPYYHIVQIANFYEKLLQGSSTSKQALDKMLQIGGNRFNIFVLHKFINIMRKTNG